MKYEIDEETMKDIENKIMQIFEYVFDKEKRAYAKIATIELMEILHKIKGNGWGES